MLTNISLWLWNLCLPSDSLLFKLYRNYLTSRPVGCLILHGPEVHDTSGPSHQDSGQLDTGLMKESSGMMIVDIRRPSQCDRAPDSWQLTGPRRQHAGCQHNTNQHPAAGTAPGHCPCGHCLRLRHVWRGRLLVTAADEVLSWLSSIVSYPVQRRR